MVERLLRIGVLVLLGCHSLAAHALTLHYDPQRGDLLRQCDRHTESGEMLEARACFARLVNAGDPVVQAEAHWGLGQIQTANRIFRDAAAQSRDGRTLTRWGYLYLQTGQVNSAADLFREVLQTNPKNIGALNGLAQAQLKQFRSQSQNLLYESLQESTDNLHALLLLAFIELELQNFSQVENLLDAATELAESNDYPVLEIYAIRNAMAMLQGNPDSEWVDKALAINPHYGGIYTIPAHFYIITYRYREAVDQYRKAVKAEPDNAEALGGLGINLFRINDVFGARYYLQRAYDADPFNSEVVNTLRLLEGYDDMRVSFVDVNDLQTGEPIGRVQLRLDREEADALEPYALLLVEDALRTFVERYDFRPKKTVIVEMYDDHADFSVRTLGTPGIGLLGVTFGYVTVMDSPRARRQGDFHWGTTLWHEMAHVITIEAANHLLPRWYSEGLSVYEEWHTGPLPSREIPISTLERLDAGEFLPLADLDSGFVRPTYEGQVGVSYMQAGMVCTYIAEEWGHEALVGMLKQFADGVSTETAVQTQLGISTEEFDERFIDAMNTQYAVTLSSLSDLVPYARQIDELIELEAWEQAIDMSQELIDLYPEQISGGNGYIRLAEAQAGLGNAEESVAALQAWHKHGGHEPAILIDLADLLSSRGDSEAAIEVLESLNWVTPDQQQAHQQLGDHYLATGEPGRALREFDSLINQDTDDISAAWYGKARALDQLGDAQGARRSVLVALEHAPFYREAQRMLLDIVDSPSTVTTPTSTGEHVD